MKARTFALLGLSLILSACGPSEENTGSKGSSGSSASSGTTATSGTSATSLRLVADPGTARSVGEIKSEAAGDKDVLVVGRVSSTVPGSAMFTLIDAGLPYCGEGEREDGCSTPWDYCCEDGETKAKNTLIVEARDARGKPLADPLEDLRLLDLVVAKGKSQKDEHGNVTIVASGWFRRERPELREGLNWPRR